MFLFNVINTITDSALPLFVSDRSHVKFFLTYKMNVVVYRNPNTILKQCVHPPPDNFLSLYAFEITLFQISVIAGHCSVNTAAVDLLSSIFEGVFIPL
jgi:hypothetical protein